MNTRRTGGSTAFLTANASRVGNVKSAPAPLKKCRLCMTFYCVSRNLENRVKKFSRQLIFYDPRRVSSAQLGGKLPGKADKFYYGFFLDEGMPEGRYLPNVAIFGRVTLFVVDV